MRHLDFFYGKEQALFDNEIEIKKNRVTAVIGPSGCGKSTHIRTYNRIFNLYRDQKATGEIIMDGENILSSQTDLLELRRRIGMIFQKPSPFPMTVFDNVAYGLRQHYKLEPRRALRPRRGRAQALGDLGRGQAQAERAGQRAHRRAAAAPVHRARHRRRSPRCCSWTSRARPSTRSATAKIEELILELKSNYTIVLVTHNMQQAARVSDYTAFFFQGHIVEFGPTTQIFSNPAQKQTEEYITGRFG